MGPAPEPPKRPWRPSRVALLAGTALAALGLAADVIGVSSRPGIGGLQLGVLALGAAVALWGALERRPRAQRGLSRIFLLVGSVYLALWLVELLMAYPLNPRVNFKSHILSLQGMYEVGERVSYRHVAGYTGTFDDGVVMMPIQINHRGDRDDEPRDDHPSRARLMLVGDSFTFGQGLEDAQRIDRRIEHRSGGHVDAYDLGVMGYGSRDSLLRLRESAWWRGRSIYYLFFTNDLELSNTHPDHYTVHDGFVVPRLRADGQAYTPQELTQLLASLREQPQQGENRLALTFTLHRIRKVAYQATHRDARLSGIPEDRVAPDRIDWVLDNTSQMQQHARERGSSFCVVVLPASGEAAAQEYSSWTRTYVDGLKARGIDVLEVLDELRAEDYFAHDPHFDASGADAVAAAILAHFERSAEGSSS